MVVHLANPSAIAACKAINDLMDAAAPDGAKIRVYAGARPANANTALTGQTLLIEFVAPNPLFGAPAQVGNTATATNNAIDPVQAAATGTATFFQIVDGDDVVILDGSVTDIAGNGDLKLSNTSVVSGIDVTVVSLTAVMPEGV